jgi:osmoprotectant transport system permease protein
MDLASVHVLAQLGGDFYGNRKKSCVLDDGFCPKWIADNFDKYLDPLWRHVLLTVGPLAAGFVIAFSLALLAHRRRWLTGPITVVTGTLYTIPSIAAFFLLLPITGFGYATAFIALTAYTLLILFRNVTTGLRNVPVDAVDAATGMGLTPRQVLWRVELPLALPEIFAGLRIAFTTTVGLAAYATYAGAGGLGANILTEGAGTGGPTFKSNVVVAGGLCILLAAVGDLIILAAQRFSLPWRRAVSA